MPPIETLLARYPKKRPPMSPPMAEAHIRYFLENRERRSVIGKLSDRLEAWMHRRIASLRGANNQQAVLEIGAGTLNHLAYEHRDEDAAPYDVIEPYADFYADRPELASIRRVFADIAEIDAVARYQRIVSVAVLEHLTDLPLNIAKSGMMLQDGGIFQAGIPSESGFLWGVAWRASSGLAFKLKTGLDWGEHMCHEHVNTAPEIIQLVRYFFGDVKLSRFPFPAHHLSLYAYLEARDPDLERCRQYLRATAGA